MQKDLDEHAQFKRKLGLYAMDLVFLAEFDCINTEKNIEKKISILTAKNNNEEIEKQLVEANKNLAEAKRQVLTRIQIIFMWSNFQLAFLLFQFRGTYAQWFQACQWYWSCTSRCKSGDWNFWREKGTLMTFNPMHHLIYFPKSKYLPNLRFLSDEIEEQHKNRPRSHFDEAWTARSIVQSIDANSLAKVAVPKQSLKCWISRKCKAKEKSQFGSRKQLHRLYYGWLCDKYFCLLLFM